MDAYPDGGSSGTDEFRRGEPAERGEGADTD